MNSDHAERHISPRTLAGATILQIVPALREEPVARTAVDVANALLQSGARALIAAEDGPLAEGFKGIRGRMGSTRQRHHQPLQTAALRAGTGAPHRI